MLETPLEIVFEGMEPSEAVKSRVNQEMSKLERFGTGITAARVVIAAPDHHKSQGGIFSCRIHMTVPGKDIAVSRKADHDHRHEDAYVCINDAFQAARRQLREAVELKKGKTKNHES